METEHTTAYHDRLKLSPIRWLALEYRGTQSIEADAFGPALTIEMRNCTCHSTLSVEVAL